jgi:hypothetical protein
MARKTSRYQSGIHGGLETVPRHGYPEVLRNPDGSNAQKELDLTRPLPWTGISFSPRYPQSSELAANDPKTGRPSRWKTTIVLSILLALMTVVALSAGAELVMQKSRSSKYVSMKEKFAVTQP